MDESLPIWAILIIPISTALVAGIILFPIAGDWLWLASWLFTGSLAINMGISYLIINKKNPRVIRNRINLRKEKQKRENNEKSTDLIFLPLICITYISVQLLLR